MHTSLPGAQREGMLKLGPVGSQIGAVDRREGRWRCVHVPGGKVEAWFGGQQASIEQRWRGVVVVGGGRCAENGGIEVPLSGIAALGRAELQWPLVCGWALSNSLPLCPTSRLYSILISSHAQQAEGAKTSTRERSLPARCFFRMGASPSRVQAFAMSAQVMRGRLLEKGGCLIEKGVRLTCAGLGDPDVEKFSSSGRLGDAF